MRSARHAPSVHSISGSMSDRISPEGDTSPGRALVLALSRPRWSELRLPYRLFGRARGAQHVLQGIVALMTGVLEHRLAAADHREFSAPRSGIDGWVLNGVTVQKDVARLQPQPLDDARLGP